MYIYTWNAQLSQIYQFFMGLWEFVNTPAATENMPHCAMDVAKEIKSRRPRQAELQDFEHIIGSIFCML